MKKSAEQVEYEQHMDDLACRISDACADELIADVVYACAAVMTFSLMKLDPEDRAIIRPKLFRLIKEVESGYAQHVGN